MTYNNYSNENKYISLAEASQLCSYSQEYLGLRARQGKLRAVKIGRDWMTTEHWLNDYISEIGTKTEANKDNGQKSADQHISLREAAIDSPYSQDYLSLRVRQGKLRAVKHGRNWVTKKEWVDEYIKSVGGAVAVEEIAENTPEIIEKPELAVESETIVAPLAEKIDSTFIFHQAELNPSQPPFTEREEVEPSIQWLEIKSKKETGSIDKVRELATRLSLKYKALDENLRVFQVAPGLAGNSLKYLRVGVLTALLISGGLFLSQSQTGTKLSQGIFKALAKTGQMVAGSPEAFNAFQNKISAVPTKITEAGDVLLADAKVSGQIISQAVNESAGQTIEAAKLFVWQGQKSITSLAAGSVKIIGTTPSAIKNWNEKITYRILILPEQLANAVSGVQNNLAAVSQTGNNVLAAGQNFFINWPASAKAMVGWPEKIKNFYIGLDVNNENFKNQIARGFGQGTNNFGLAINGVIKKLSVSNALSFVYDKYLVLSQGAGHTINDGAQFALQSAKNTLNAPGKVIVLAGNYFDGVGKTIQQKVAAVNRNVAYGVRRVGLTLSRTMNLLTGNLTPYGQLARAGFFGKNIAQGPAFTPWQTGDIPFDEINKLQDEVNQLKIAMEEIKFNLAIGQEAEALPENLPQYVVGPGGQLTQNITQVQNITQNLPISDYAKASDMVATEIRLFDMLGKIQSGVIAQSSNYTTNNFYSWAATQKIDNLNNITIDSGMTLRSGQALFKTTEQTTFWGNVDMLSGLDISGANLTVGGASFIVDNYGNLDMAGNLTVGGNQTLRGDLTVIKNSYLGSNTSTSTLTVKGPSTFTVASSTEALYVTQYGIGAGIVVNASSSTSTLAVYQNGIGTALDIFQNNVGGNLIRLQNATGTLFLIDGFGQVTLGTTTADTSIRGRNIFTQLGDDNSLYNFALKNFSGSTLLAINSGGNLTLNANATSSIFSDVAFDTNTLYIDSINNRVGLGTTSPLATFSIQGTVPGQVDLFTVASSTGANLLAFNANGNLGIGTSSPVSRLSIVGDSYFTGNHYQQGNATTTGYLNIGQLLSVSGTGTSTFADDVAISGQLDVTGISSFFSPILLADGSMTAPALSFVNDQNLGLFRPAADQLAISTDGTQRAVFDALGQMGIGTTSPAATLHVVDATEQLRLGFDGQNYTTFTVGADGALAIVPTNNATTTIANALALTQPQAYFLNNGKIGFGTMSPSAALEIATTTTQLRLAYNVANYSELTAALDGALTISTTNTGTTTITNAFQAASSFYVLNNGNVGLGTAGPAYKLDVNGTLRTTGSVVLGDATSSDVLYINSRVASSLVPTIDNVLDLGDGANWLRWRTGYFGTSVGIGGTATSTGTSLTYNGTGLISSGDSLSINAGQASIWQTLVGDLTLQSAAQLIASSTTNTIFANGGVERARLTTTGNFGLASSSPSFVLSLIGDSYFNGNHYQQGNATTTGYFNVGQLLSVSGTGTSTFASNLSVGGSFDTTGTSYFRAPLLLSDGSATAPAMSFIADQNTGLFRPAADSLAFSTGGAEWVRVDSTGNVGIGTTSPATTLHVVDTTEQLRLGFNGQNYTSFTTGADGAIVIVPTNNATTTIANALALSQPQAYFLNNGKIGFGTMSPSAALEIATTTTQLRLSYDVADYADFTVANDGALTINTTNTGTTTITNAFQAASSFYVLNNGNVGLGTMIPANKLDVNGSMAIGSYAGVNAATANSLIVSGNVGIGTSTPLSQLSVVSSGNAVPSLVVAGYSASQTADLFQARQYPAATPAFVIDSSGQVGIASSSPSSVLSLVGNSYFTGNHYQQGNATTTGYLNIGQLLSVSGVGTSTFADNLQVGGNLEVLGDQILAGSQTITGDLFVNGNTTLGDASGDTLTFNASTLAIPNNLNIDSNTLYIDASNNRVAINNASPAYAFDVTGAGRFTSYVDTAYFVATSTTATSTFAGGLTVNANTFVVDPDAGRVGIASSSPNWIFSINGAGNGFAINSSGAVVQGSWTGFSISDAYLDNNLTITGGSIDSTTAIDKDPIITLGADLSGSVTLSNLADGTLNATIADNSVDGTDIALGSDAAGDLMYYNGADYARLGIGLSGYVLTSSGGLPAWVATTTLATISGTLSVDKGGTGQTSFTSSQLLYGAGSGALQSAATSTISVGNGISVTSGSLGYQVGGSNVAIGIATNALALTQLPQIGANSILGNITGATGNVAAIASSSLFTWTGTGDVVRAVSPTLVTPNLGTPTALVLTNATGLPVAGGGTGTNTFTSSQLLYGVGSGALQSVATSSLSLGLGLSGSNLGYLVGGSSPSLSIATSSLYSGAAGQFPYFSGANTLSATSSISDVYLDNNLTIAGGTISGTSNTIALGSDAVGDIYYRDSSGYLARLALGQGGYVLTSSGSLPAWAATSTIGVQGRGNGAANQVAYWTDANTISSSANYTFNPSTNLLAVLGNASTTQLTTTGSTYLATTDGNVGIGTSTPNNLLTLATAISDNALSFTTNNTSRFTMGVDYSDANKFKIETASTLGGATPAFVIDSGGQVGIGTSTPVSKLQVAMDADTRLTITDTNAAADQKHWFMESNDGSFAIGTTSDALLTNTTYRAMTISPSGNVGIGTTSPYKKLAVEGGLYVSSAATFASSVQIDGPLNVDGNFSVTTDVMTIDSATGDLTSNGTGWFKTDFKVDGNATTTGTQRVGSNLTVGGNFNLAGIATITGTATSTGNLGTSGDFYALGNITTSGVFRASNGSALLPSYTFTSDLNTGLFSAAADELALATNGSERMRLDAAGNIGIGTVSPTSLLHLASTTADAAMTFASGPGNWIMGIDYSDGGKFKISSSTALGTNDRLTIDTTGNVGIGTTGPGALLHVAGPNDDTGSTATGALVLSRYWAAADATRASAIYHRYNFANSNDQLVFAVSGDGGASNYNTPLSNNTKMVIETSGNVGIGTTSPQAKFVVNGASGGESSIPTLGSHGGTFEFTVDGNRYGLIGGVLSTGNTYLQSQRVDGTATAYNLLLQPTAGNVGIGTTAPGTKLHVYGNGAVAQVLVDTSSGSFDPSFALTTAGAIASEGLKIWYDASVGSSYFDSVLNAANSDLHFRTKTAGTPVEALFIKSDGNVGIGTVSPNQKLTVFSSFGTEDTIPALGAQGGKFALLNSTGGGAQGNGLLMGVIADGTGYIQNQRVDGTATAYNLLLNPNAGNVGIGTTNPTSKFTVSGNQELNAANSILKINTEGSDYGIRLHANSYYGGTWGTRIWKDHHTGGIALRIDTQSDATWYNGVIISHGGQAADPKFGVYGGAVFGANYTGVALPPSNGAIIEGSVGIGTTDPVSKLHVYSSDSDVTGTVETDGAAKFARLTLSNPERDMILTNNTTDDLLSLFYAGANRLQFDTTNQWFNTGNVGIGTTLPGSLLQLSTSNQFRVYVAEGIISPTYYELGTVNDNNGVLQISGILGGHTQAQGRANIDVSFSVRDGFTSLGNVWGTVGSAADIVVYDDAANARYIVYLKTDDYGLTNLELKASSGAAVSYTGSGSTVAPVYSLIYTLSTDAGQIVRSLTNGNVGIGTTNPGYILDVNGVARITAQGMAGYGTLNVEGVDPFIRIKDTDGEVDKKKWDIRVIGSDAGLNFRTINDADTVFSTKMVILNSGNVGIGTIAPGAIFEVNYRDGSTNIMRISDDGSGAYRFRVDQNFDLIMNNASSDTAKIDNDGSAYFLGNVGIGTTAPERKLTVVGASGGASDQSGILLLTTGTGVNTDHKMQFGIVDGSYAWIQSIKPGTDNMPLVLNPTAGNVGIGTASPAGKLHIYSKNNEGVLLGTPYYDNEIARKNSIDFLAWRDTYDGNNGFIGATIASTRTWVCCGGFPAAGYAGIAYTDLVFNTRDSADIAVPLSEKMRLSYNGNVGIGTTVPGAPLEVYKSQNGVTQVTVSNPTVGTSNQARFTASSDSVTLDMGVTAASTAHFGSIPGAFFDVASGKDMFFSDGGSINMFIKNDGNVGIGTTNPGYPLQIRRAGAAGSLGITFDNTADARDVLYYSIGDTTDQTTGHIFYTRDSSATDVARLTIRSTGNVGIGTTDPAGMLQVGALSGTTGGWVYFNNNVGPSNANPSSFSGIALGWNPSNAQGESVIAYGSGTGSAGGGSARRLALVEWDGTTRNERLTIKDGNVGIGTAGPGEKLDVNGKIKSNDAIYISKNGADATGGGPFFQLNSASGTTYVQLLQLGSSGNLDFHSYDGSTWHPRVMSITNTGNVGIGTTAPVGKLDIYTSAVNTLQGGPNIRLTRDYTNGDYGSAIYSGWTAGTGDTLVFGVAANADPLAAGYEKMVITENGNVGIGTTSPTAKLYVHDGTDTNLRMYGSSGVFVVSAEIDAGSAQVPLNINNSVRILTNGNVGIGTTSPTAKLMVRGAGTTTGKAFSVIDSSNVEKLTVLDSGNVGIGTVAPGARLEVYQATNDAYIRTKTSTAGAYFQADSATDGWYGLNLSSAGVGKWFIGAYGSTSYLGFTRGAMSNTPSMVMDTAGNVGIGTTNPTQRLTVVPANSAGAVAAFFGAYTGATGANTSIQLGYDGNASQIANARLRNDTEVDGGSALILEAASAGNTFNANQLVLSSAGNVGIGTTGPTSKLHIDYGSYIDSAIPGMQIDLGDHTSQSGIYLNYTKASNSQGLLISQTYAGGSGLAAYALMRVDNRGSNPTFYSSNNGSNPFIINSAGNVGIGTTSPEAKMHIMGDSGGDETTGSALLKLNDTYEGASERGIISIAHEWYGSQSFAVSNYGNVYLYDVSGNLKTQLSPVADSFFNGGNVGIGTTNPTLAMLQVAGDIYTTGNMSALSITDRTAYPQDLTQAYEAVMSMERLPDGLYDPANSEMQLDHSKLSPFITSATGERDLSASVSSINEVTKYILNSLGGLPGIGELSAKVASSTADLDALGSGFHITNSEGSVIFSGSRAMASSSNRDMTLSAGSIILNGNVGVGTSSPGNIFNVASSSGESFFKISSFGSIGIGTSTPTAESSLKVAVGGDLGATGFVNLSTREAKKDIEYLGTADYKAVLAKISGDVKPATYSYNSDEDCLQSTDYGLQQNANSGGSQSSVVCSRRLGLIAEEAPLEVLSADGQGVDLYKLATFTLMGVKGLASEVNEMKIKVDSLEARIESLEKSSPALLYGKEGADGFQMALETLGGEPIILAPSSIVALSSGLYSSILAKFESLGVVIRQGVARFQNLIADVLQINQLAVNIAPQTDANGQTKDATIGSGQINVGELNTYIMNNQISTTTKIFITPEQPVAIGICETHAQPEYVGNIERPRGFMVCMSATSSQIVKFSWWIIKTTSEAGMTNDQIPMTNQIQNPNDQNPNVQVTPSETPVSTPAPSEIPAATTTPTPTETPTPTPTVTPEAIPTTTITPTPDATSVEDGSSTSDNVGTGTPTPDATPISSGEPATTETLSVPEP